MLDNWIQIARLLLAFLLAAGVGTHAYYQHKREEFADVSARRWVYGLYAAVFLLASAANFAQFCITVVFHNYQNASLHLGYLTLLLLLSYAVVLVGVSRRPY